MITNIKEFKEFNEKKQITDTAKPKPGKMHKVLGIADDKDIVDVYTSGKKLATDLVKAVGKKKAASMITFVANINPEVNVYDKALKALDKIEESVINENSNISNYNKAMYIFERFNTLTELMDSGMITEELTIDSRYTLDDINENLEEEDLVPFDNMDEFNGFILACKKQLEIEL